jgi:glucose/arabinose dehydrogenase
MVGVQTILNAPGAWPASFAFDDDGKIYYGQRFTGEIRILNPANDKDKLFFTLPNLVGGGERGLLGLALHPSFPDKPYVYAYYTRQTDSGIENQIVRITSSKGKGKKLKTLVRLASASIHNGGVIHFGPDNRLYAVVGEVGNPANAQNLDNEVGKVLRMTANGGVPEDNPFDNRIWSFGLRNSFGFTFDPQTGNLWQTENGPNCNDELNRITKGGNFAWGPSQTCVGVPPENTNRDGPQPRIMPLAWYTPTTAPTGAAFCEGCGLGGSIEGRLIYGNWNRGELKLVTLTQDRLGIASEELLLDRTSGILAVERGSDNGVYFSDSDGIYKLTP